MTVSVYFLLGFVQFTNLPGYGYTIFMTHNTACAADGAHRVHRAIGRPIDAWLPSCSNEKNKRPPIPLYDYVQTNIGKLKWSLDYFLDGLSSASLFASACNLASSSAGNRPKEEVPVA